MSIGLFLTSGWTLTCCFGYTLHRFAARRPGLGRFVCFLQTHDLCAVVNILTGCQTSLEVSCAEFRSPISCLTLHVNCSRRPPEKEFWSPWKTLRIRIFGLQVSSFHFGGALKSIVQIFRYACTEVLGLSGRALSPIFPPSLSCPSSVTTNMTTLLGGLPPVPMERECGLQA